jgi:predicted ester cyclase
MQMWKGLLFLGGFVSLPLALDEARAEAQAAAPEPEPKQLVREFLEQVRAGRHPERAGEFLAEHVVAHQLVSEAPIDVQRSPQDYAAHVAGFRQAYGNFRFEVTELIAEGDRVYARWRQVGCHVGEVDGHAPTRKPVVEVASAVYRVQSGRIVEYWIQVDRLGTETQLRENAATHALAACA